MYMGFYPVQRQNAGVYPVQRQSSRSHHRSGSPNQNQPANNTQNQQAANLIGYHVKINRGGPDSVEGTLIAVPADYLVLSSRDGIVYVNGSHVKSITEGNASASRSRSANYIAASSFQSLLGKLRHEFIMVNRGGPEKVEGFLAEVNSNFLLLIVGREYVRIPVYHIKTVSVTSNKSGNKSNKNNNNNNSNGKKGNNKSGGQSGGQQGGNRTGGRSGGRSGGRQSGRSGGRSRNGRE